MLGWDASLWDVGAHGSLGRLPEVFVGAGEGVDAVVVGAVGEGAQLVEKVVAAPAADDLEEPVFGGGGDGLGSDLFRAGRAPARDGVAAEDVSLVAVGE